MEHNKKFKEDIKHFTSESALNAQHMVDFYDGMQLPYMAKIMSGTSGRKEWEKRGYRLNYRNITRNIIDKSGLLYNKGLPLVEVMTDDTVDESMTDALMQFSEDCELDEYLINADSIIRLLRTCYTLVQLKTDEEDCFTNLLLHSGNSHITADKKHNKVSRVTYVTKRLEKVTQFRTITEDIIQDWETNKEGLIKILSTEDNVLGFVPIVAMHDTNIPRHGLFNTLNTDLIDFNVSYNMYMMDIIFSASWAQRKTLYTNARLADENYENTGTTQDKLGRNCAGNGQGDFQSLSTTAGPDQVVVFDTTGVESPFLDYKGPDIPLAAISELYQTFVTDIASDYSVRIEAEGSASASSGFQIVVEERDTLELREKRQRMAERYLNRLYKLMAKISSIRNPMSIKFKEDFKLNITFAKPSLPVEKDKELSRWLTLIDRGLKTIKDYFIEVDGLTEAEADDKANLAIARKSLQAEQIIEDNRRALEGIVNP